MVVRSAVCNIVADRGIIFRRSVLVRIMSRNMEVTSTAMSIPR